MRLIYILMLLISLPIFAQPKAMEIKIDSIITDKSNPKSRKFIINYSITNLTKEKLSFFLKPNSLVNTAFGSMSNAVCYKIVSNEEIVDTHEIFESPERNFTQKELMEFRKQYDTDSIAADENYTWRLKNKSLMKDISSINPQETIKVCYEFLWNKTRYYKRDDYEYYIDEQKPYFIEMFAILLKEQYKDELTPEQYQKIIDDKNFIKGLFVSNKMAIDFSE